MISLFIELLRRSDNGGVAADGDGTDAKMIEKALEDAAADAAGLGTRVMIHGNYDSKFGVADDMKRRLDEIDLVKDPTLAVVQGKISQLLSKFQSKKMEIQALVTLVMKEYDRVCVLQLELQQIKAGLKDMVEFPRLVSELKSMHRSEDFHKLMVYYDILNGTWLDKAGELLKVVSDDKEYGEKKRNLDAIERQITKINQATTGVTMFDVRPLLDETTTFMEAVGILK